MARSFAKILLKVWNDPEFLALPALSQRAYFVLISHAKLTHAGMIPLQVNRWSKLAPDTTPADIDECMVRLTADRFVVVDEDTEEALVRSFIRHDGGFKNMKMRKAVESAIDKIESETLRAVAVSELERALASLQAEGQTDPPSDPASQDGSDETSDPTYSQQPGAVSLEPASRSPEPSPSNGDLAAAAEKLAALDPAAAAAIAILVDHRVHTEKDIRIVDRYSNRIIIDTIALAADRLEDRARRGEDDVTIAVNVLGVTGHQARTAKRRIEARQVRDPDPDCTSCAGEGIFKNDDDRWHDCHCRNDMAPVVSLGASRKEATA